ncbi:hypothetical protein K438DRAFT_256609 [Mycena galopus ATCC 62051]|nr:hypothetical protein K438DRAFT_256609 [Mycena galopus ATCC 62051]
MFFLGTCGTVVVVIMTCVAIRIVKGVVQGSNDLSRLVECSNGPAFSIPLLHDLGIKKEAALRTLNACSAVLNVVVWLRKPGGQGAYLIDSRAPFLMTLGTNLLLILNLLAGAIKDLSF